MWRTFVVAVAQAAVLICGAAPAMGTRLARSDERQGMLIGAVQAVDASSGDTIDYAIVNHYRGAEYGLLLAGTGNEYGLTILKHTASGWIPEVNGSDMGNGCSDLGGPINQAEASACLAFDYVPRGTFESGVKFMPIHCGRGENVLKFQPSFLKLGYYDPVDGCFRAHPYRFISCKRVGPEAVSHGSCGVAVATFNAWGSWARKLMGDGWREVDVKAYEAVLATRGHSVTCTPTIGRNIFCWTGSGHNLMVFSEHVALQGD
jgi:hypothetical protein